MAERLPLDFTVMEHGFRFRFADVTVAHYARKLFVLYLQGQVQPESDLFAVELVFGELIGNVARHAPGPVEVHVLWEGEGARLEVWDHGPGYEMQVALPEDTMDQTHRGLFIVASLASGLSVERRGGQTVTSVNIALRRHHE